MQCIEILIFQVAGASFLRDFQTIVSRKERRIFVEQRKEEVEMRDAGSGYKPAAAG